jgi:hypothetical protein
VLLIETEEGDTKFQFEAEHVITRHKDLVQVDVSFPNVSSGDELELVMFQEEHADVLWMRSRDRVYGNELALSGLSPIKSQFSKTRKVLRVTLAKTGPSEQETLE